VAKKTVAKKTEVNGGHRPQEPDKNHQSVGNEARSITQNQKTRQE